MQHKKHNAKLATVAAAILGVWLGSSTSPAFADSMSAGAGVASVNSFSSEYKARADMLPYFQFKLNRDLSGRWSALGEYLTTVDATFSGFGLGVAYDSALPRAELEKDGREDNAAIVVVPKWHFRGSVAAGRWRYSSILDKAESNLASDRSPIEADLYGASIEGTASRFLTDEIAIQGTLSSVFAFASSFSVNALGATIGIGWFYK